MPVQNDADDLPPESLDRAFRGGDQRSRGGGGADDKHRAVAAAGEREGFRRLGRRRTVKNNNRKDLLGHVEQAAEIAEIDIEKGASRRREPRQRHTGRIGRREHSVVNCAVLVERFDKRLSGCRIEATEPFV